MDVVIGELPKLTGTSTEGDNAWRELGSWLRTLDDVDGATLARRRGGARGGSSASASWLPRVPGALVLVAGGLLASWLFDLEARGVALVGDVPRGLPAPELPGWTLVQDNLAVIAIASFALLLIGFSQTAGDARVFAARHDYRIDVDQEAVAQGMANVGAGVFQGMPVSTSLSASSLNESAGARSQVASLTTGALVVATLLVLAPLFSQLPKAVLGAVIIDAVVFGMIDVRELRRLHRVARFDFWIAAAAIVGVLSVGVLMGVVVGVVLSVGWLVYVATRPPMPLLGREHGTGVFRELEGNPDDETFRGAVVVRLDGGLFFATAEALEDRVRALVEGGSDVRTLVLDLQSVPFIDAQGAEGLRHVHQIATGAGVVLRLAHVKPRVMAVLRLDGLEDEIGPDHVYGKVQQALDAYLGEQRGARG